MNCVRRSIKQTIVDTWLLFASSYIEAHLQLCYLFRFLSVATLLKKGGGGAMSISGGASH